MELLVHDAVEQILERLPPKSLLRFKSVSKQWKSTIESPFFQHNHLSHHRQKSKNPDIFLVTINYKVKNSIITLELESSISNNIPIPWDNNHFFMVCQNSIDGLICLYDEYNSVIIYNPATRWYRILPPSIHQQRHSSLTVDPLGFGKDEIKGLYKPVWLYNSNDNATITCEVFDFKINAWRFVEPSLPERISVRDDDPVYLNGLLYWLTEEEEYPSVIVSFDLHTETFEIVCNVPFTNMILHNLNNNELCISNEERSEVIWSLNLEEKTWKKIYFIDLHKICPLCEDCWCLITALVFMEEKKRKFMLCDYHCCDRNMEELILYDSQAMSYRVIAKGEFSPTVCYFQSLISIL